MEYYDWVKEFKPLSNHLDENASIDGYLFMPYGNQWEFVKSFDFDQLWTLIITDLDFDKTSWEIVSGIHIVNREGYLITENKYLEDFLIVY